MIVRFKVRNLRVRVMGRGRVGGRGRVRVRGRGRVRVRARGRVRVRVRLTLRLGRGVVGSVLFVIIIRLRLGGG